MTMNSDVKEKVDQASGKAKEKAATGVDKAKKAVE